MSSPELLGPLVMTTIKSLDADLRLRSGQALKVRSTRTLLFAAAGEAARCWAGIRGIQKSKASCAARGSGTRPTPRREHDVRGFRRGWRLR